MAFMQPIAEYLTEVEVREYIYEPSLADGGDPDEPLAGWYGRLSAPGYLDCTDWDGPYLTEVAALSSVQSFYEVDENGDDL